MKQKCPNTLDDAATATLEMESYVSSPNCTGVVSTLQPESEPASIAAIGPVEKLTRMVERLTERVEILQLEASRASRHPTDTNSQRPKEQPGRPRMFDGECWRCTTPARPHRTQLHSEPPITTGKLETASARGREPEGEPIKAHTNVYVCVYPTTLTGGYRLSGAVNSPQMSLLLDTGAAVTLLREDTWARAAAKNLQELQPRSTLKLVSGGGTPLTILGSTCVELELEGAKKFTTEVVVVSPLTSEAILGLDFFKQLRVRIDLENKQLHLTDCTLPLREL